jgi:uncharacterized protein YndB with AHSA1/START domain
MADLIRRTLDWIDEAPVRISARAVSAAPPDAVFAVLADHEGWPEWFPMVRRVTVLGPAVGVGARRRVAIPGASVDEEFIAWEPGRRWSFTGIASRPRFTRSLVEDCRLDPTPDGGTSIDYTMYLDPPPAFGLLFGVLRGRVAANNRRAVEALARRAEAASP